MSQNIITLLTASSCWPSDSHSDSVGPEANGGHMGNTAMSLKTLQGVAGHAWRCGVRRRVTKQYFARRRGCT
eukprot:3605046-Amphidinium_carterae.2